MRDFRYRVGDDAEIYFYIYDATKQRQISERFLVRISKDDFSTYMDLPHSNCTVFSDLGKYLKFISFCRI
jgi:dedicator of cytokinesis protein 3